MTVVCRDLDEEDVVACLLAEECLVFKDIFEFQAALPEMLLREWLTVHAVQLHSTIQGDSEFVTVDFNSKHKMRVQNCDFADSTLHTYVHMERELVCMFIMHDSPYYQHYKTLYHKRRYKESTITSQDFCVPVDGLEDNMHQDSENVKLKVTQYGSTERPRIELIIDVMGRQVGVKLSEDAPYMAQDMPTVPGCDAVTMSQVDWAKEQIARALQDKALQIMKMGVEVEYVKS